MFVKIKIFGSHENYTRYEKNFIENIILVKMIYKFTSEHFLIRHVVFVLIVKNAIDNERFYFVSNPRKILKKFLE